MNTSKKGRYKGTQIRYVANQPVGGEIQFEHQGARYLLKLVDIKSAGKIPTLAACFSARKAEV